MDKNRLQLLVRLGYDGARFHGVAPQPALPTVHSALARRLEAAAGCRPRALAFAARTDRGVHAIENLATCWFPSETAFEGLVARLAAERDDGLVGVEAQRVAPSVYARGLSQGKRYRYVVETGWEGARRHPGPWRIYPDLRLDWMETARAPLLGTHDFRSFSVRHPDRRPSVRTLTRVDLSCDWSREHPRWIFVLEGDGFLRRMVRLLVGTLVECGAGLLDPNQIPAALAARDNTWVGRPAPAGGLTLARVFTEAR